MAAKPFPDPAPDFLDAEGLILGRWLTGTGDDKSSNYFAVSFVGHADDRNV